MNKKRTIMLFIIFIFCILLVTCFGMCFSDNYDIYFQVSDTIPDGKGKKAKIILLAGQSNAVGCSIDQYLQKNISGEKYKEYSNGYDNVFINYFSDDVSSNGFVTCKNKQGFNGICFGPELGIAETLHSLYPDQVFFIIKYARGASTLNNHWLSPSSFGKTGYLYQQFISFVDANIEYLESKNYIVDIKALCWMQGESDSYTEKMASKYESYLNNFIRDIRYRYNKFSTNDGLAFIDAYIANIPDFWIYYQIINTAKYNISLKSNLNVVIDTIAEELTCLNEPEDEPDKAHYDSLSELKLGHLFGKELIKFLD